ncbi:hypothetical protein DOY81_013024 [Sarcophaga bullata]|nr:hypothetical protein DOY81_013024 [Sarcophaga bullata]
MENLAKFPASTEAGVCKSDILTKGCAAAGGAETGSGEPAALGVKATPTVSARTSSWLAALHVNNNNNAEKTYSVKEQQLHKCNNVVNPLNTFNNTTITNAPWPCDSCDTYQTIGSGTSTLNASTLLPRLPLSFNGSALASAASSDIDTTATVVAAAAAAAASFHQTETDYDAYDMCGAVSLSPPLLEDHFAISATGGAGIGGGHSNRTSLNNSTENLSYISDNFLRDDSHIARRKTFDRILYLVTPTQRHQLFSSPIDDLPPAPKALQAQSLLTKNFARITLHLDQIQKDYNDDLSDEGRERLNSALDSRPLEEEFASDVLTTDTSHSLPNTLHEHFTNRCNSESAVVTNIKDNTLNTPLQTLTHKSPSKITGAKPKRLSTFSSTSSTSSKNSSKSRNSLRSAFPTTNIGNNTSFDERSVSCSEFRTERDLTAPGNINNSKPSLLASAPHTAPSTAAILNTTDFNAFSEETCLDCLEKEFLANTIGKALDPQGCLKCRKRLGHLSLYNTPRSTASDHSRYRRSASPTTTFFFSDQPSPTSRLFSCEFLNSQARKRQEWESYAQEQKESDFTASVKAAPVGGASTIETASNRNESNEKPG